MGKNHKEGDTDAGRAVKQIYMYLSERDAEATKNSVIKLLCRMNVKTINFDNGKEFAYPKEMSEKLRIEIYPYTSYEKDLNEYTNRLLRQYFLKKMDL